MTRIVNQTNTFVRNYKKLHNHQKDAVDQAIKTLMLDPTLGNSKKGDLAGIYVYKFDCVGQQFLLAYQYDPQTLRLLLLGAHENFYRKLKQNR